MTLGTFYQKRFVPQSDLRTGTCLQFVGAMVIAAPLALVTETLHFDLTTTSIAALAWSVVVLSIVAIALLLLMIRHGEVSRVAALIYLVPPLVAIEAFVLFGESLNAVQMVGMVRHRRRRVARDARNGSRSTAGLDVGKKRRTSASRLSASTERISASDLTSTAVARALSLAPATRLMASAPPRASIEATIDALGDRRHRRVLLLDRRGDGRSVHRHFLDDRVDLLDRLCRVGDSRLDGADLPGDFLGRLAGLSGERLHLGGDDRKAPAGGAGARRLDGRVEREKIGLPGDRLDQADHFADPVGGEAELGHGACTVRRASLTARPATSVERMA